MCKKKNTIILVAIQLTVLSVFCLFALGSASYEQATRGAGQAITCSALGYTFIGYYSNADCPIACGNKGYNGGYCTGTDTVSCYCK